jgi:hypothetical protein
VVKVFQGERSSVAPMRALAIFSCVVGAIVALWLASLTSWGLYLIGFPDGHVTDYDAATEAPLKILRGVEFGFVFLFLAFALSPIGARARAVGLLVALVGLVLVVLVQFVGVPWYFGTHLGLDNGVGG